MEKQSYEVSIDFDEASQAWRHNKKSLGNGVDPIMRVSGLRLFYFSPPYYRKEHKESNVVPIGERDGKTYSRTTFWVL